MGRVAVLCPSRSRPEGLDRLTKSVAETSTKASVWAYVDEDQHTQYPLGGGPMRFVVYGRRVGPVASANHLAGRIDADVYGLITDDSIITTPGWDDWVLETVKQFPNKICVISPHHNQGDHVDMPFVTREWIETVGWYACPKMHHYCWPIVTGLIGEMTAIVHAPEQAFSISHDYTPGTNAEVRQRDSDAFFDFVSLGLMPVVERVRSAMYTATV